MIVMSLMTLMMIMIAMIALQMITAKAAILGAQVTSRIQKTIPAPENVMTVKEMTKVAHLRAAVRILGILHPRHYGEQALYRTT
jgi:hypothetical protein